MSDDGIEGISEGIHIVNAWLIDVFEGDTSGSIWNALDDSLRLALAQSWVMYDVGDEDDQAAAALSARNSTHPRFLEMTGALVERWQSVYEMLKGERGVLNRTFIAGIDLELIVLTSPQDVGELDAGSSIVAHSFITRLADDGWRIAALARRLPVPGWPPTEQEIPNLLA